MFVRLVAVSERLVSLESAFEYKLTQQPMSLFTKGMMRKGDKSVLFKAFMQDDSLISTGEVNIYNDSIIDGGALVHSVQWKKKMKFEEIAMKHIQYIQRWYNYSTVVFNGYAAASKKDQEHSRRCWVPLSLLFPLKMMYLPLIPKSTICH